MAYKQRLKLDPEFRALRVSLVASGRRYCCICGRWVATLKPATVGGFRSFKLVTRTCYGPGKHSYRCHNHPQS